MRRKNLVFWLFLLGCAPQGPSTFSPLSLNDVDLIEPRPDGTFQTHCRDGRVQIVTQEQMSQADKFVCVPPGSLPAPSPGPVLCGNYDKPVILREGTNIVTCDVRFKAPVILQPGARFLTDDNWTVEFSDIFAYGTLEKPIEFGLSSQTQGKSFGKILVSPKSALLFNPDMSYKSGALMRNIKFTAPVQLLDLEKGVYLTDIAGDFTRVKSKEGYLGHSDLKNLSELIVENGYFISNEVNSASQFRFLARKSFIAWNRMGLHYYDDLTNNYLIFNQLKNSQGPNEYYSQALIYGNNQADSSGIVVGPFPFFAKVEVTPEDPIAFPLIIADQSGWRFEIPLTTTPTFTNDGITSSVKAKTTKGYYPSFEFEEKESYEFKFSAPSISNFISPEFQVDVY